MEVPVLRLQVSSRSLASLGNYMSKTKMKSKACILGVYIQQTKYSSGKY